MVRRSRPSRRSPYDPFHRSLPPRTGVRQRHRPSRSRDLGRSAGADRPSGVRSGRTALYGRGARQPPRAGRALPGPDPRAAPRRGDLSGAGATGRALHRHLRHGRRRRPGVGREREVDLALRARAQHARRASQLGDGGRPRLRAPAGRRHGERAEPTADGAAAGEPRLHLGAAYRDRARSDPHRSGAAEGDLRARL